MADLASSRTKIQGVGIVVNSISLAKQMMETLRDATNNAQTVLEYLSLRRTKLIGREWHRNWVLLGNISLLALTGDNFEESAMSRNCASLDILSIAPVEEQSILAQRALRQVWRDDGQMERVECGAATVSRLEIGYEMQ